MSSYLLFCYLNFLHYIIYAQGNPNSPFHMLVDDYQKWRVADSPEYGTILGWNTLDDQLQQYTEEAFGSTVRNARSFLDRANSIEESDLNKQDKITLYIIRDGLQTVIKGYQYRKYGMYNPIFTLSNPVSNLKYMFMDMPTKNVTHFENILARLRAIPVQFSQLITLMKEAIDTGITCHGDALTGVVEYMKSQIVDSVEKSLFYKVFINITEGIDEANRSRLQNEAQETIMELVMPAMRNLTWFVETQYSPATRAEPGLSSLPGGGEAYAECLRWHTSTDMTPDQVHQLGLQEVERIRKEMKQIMIEDGFNGTLQEYRDLLYNQSELFFKDSDQILTRTRAIINDVKQKMHMVLNNVPKGDIEIRPFDIPGASGGAYTPPSPDGSHPGIFWISLDNPTSAPQFKLLSLTLHEAEPGHHTQVSFSGQLNIPAFRKFEEYRRVWATPFNWPVYNAYIEGWALYAESLGEDLGVYINTYDKLGKLSWEIFRACRLVVDTGIHAFGWSKQEAVDYMYNNTMHSIESVTDEMNRYIGYPGQACSYKIGELTMKDLRKEAVDRLGSKFRLQDFNDEILSLGSCPMSILKEHMREWITIQQNSHSAANCISRRHDDKIYLVTFIYLLKYCWRLYAMI